MTDITTPMRIEEHDEEAFLLEDYQSDGESIVSRCEPNTEIGLSEKSMELAIK